MASEKRKSPRKRLRYPGQIVTGKDAEALLCALSDISETGARVVMHGSGEIPHHVTLLFGPGGAAERRCRVAWRDGEQIGLEFIKPEKSKTPPTLRSLYKDRR
jgi:hypothetical protein